MSEKSSNAEPRSSDRPPDPMALDLKGMSIAVLMGGPGSERKVSLKSGEGVVEALRSMGAVVTPVDVTGPDFVLPPGTRVAFNVIHGTFGEDGRVQRILEALGVAYTGEGVIGSELAIDKIASKRRFVERGVPTAAFEVIRRGGLPSIKPPLVIKAPREGSSVGVYIVKAPGELVSALDEAWKFGDELLIEEFVAGRELTVGIIGDFALPVVEIRARDDFYNFDNKYPFLNPAAAGADHFCPAPLSAELTELVQSTGRAAHRALDLEVYSRVDILLTDAGKPFVLEVNTIPGMTQASLLPEAAAVIGISYADLCRRIIAISIAARHARR